MKQEVNIFNQTKEFIADIVKDLAQKNSVDIAVNKFDIFTVEPCKERSHGDVATNAAMILAGDFKMSPAQLAGLIVKELTLNSNIKQCQVAGPGFINIIFDKKIWYNFLLEILGQKEFVLPNFSNGEKINLEYASPNPTGPMHVGHTRGAIYGDVLANLLIKTGFDVTKEYYINDAGAQIITLVKSAYLRYLESLGQKITIPEGLYPGEYLIEIGHKLKEKFADNLLGKSEEQYIPLIRDFVVDAMMEMIKEDLAKLGIKHDVFSSEKKKLHDSGKIDQAIKILKDKGLIYEGILEAPKGKTPEDYSQEVQTLFKSTLFGDDCDRVVKKSDGTPTYLAGDIAYSLDKFQRGFNKMILPLGFDHAGYVKRLDAVVKAISDNKAQVKVILCQMVKFVKDGEPMKMSKRAGNFVTARDLIDEVGADVIRFTMLTRKNDAPFDFDLKKMVEQSKDNPIFYVQYAYARCSSILRNLEEEIPSLINLQNFNPKDEVIANLSSEIELDLIKKLANYPRIIEMAVKSFEPHRIAFYLQELAALFHSFWNEGKKDANLRFIIASNKDLTMARIALVLVFMKVVANALSIFNIKPLERME